MTIHFSIHSLHSHFKDAVRIDARRVYLSLACCAYATFLTGFVAAFSSTTEHLVYATGTLVLCLLDFVLLVQHRADRAKSFITGITAYGTGLYAIVSIFHPTLQRLVA